MTPRQDQRLQQLGIMQWSLHRPGALQGEIVISVPMHVCLVMVVTQLPAPAELLISYILCALTASPDQALQLASNRVAMLSQGNHCDNWRLGTEGLLLLGGAQVESPAFNKLRENPTAHAALRQRIYTCEYNFFPRADWFTHSISG